jgi:hypothetical protein
MIAVINRTNALNLYAGHQNITASSKWVSPQVSINAPNNQKTKGNGIFGFFRINCNKNRGITK